MNTDQVKGNWKQFSGKLKEQWGKLTDNDLTVIDGKREQLVGKIQEHYGVKKEEAEKQLADFAKNNNYEYADGTYVYKEPVKR